MIRLNSLRNLPIKWWAFNVCMVGGLVLLITNTPFNKTEIEEINSRLNTIQTQLINLQQEIRKPAEKIDFGFINQDFNKLESLIEQLKSKNENQLSQLMSENKTDLTNKLDTIHQVINSLNNKQNPIKFLPITALPFHVVSIDSIQQISVASVVYDFKTVPLEIGDELAGWTVMHVDFGKQRLELENTNKERVLVTLKQEEPND